MKKTTLNLLLSAFLIGNLSLSAAAQSTDVPQKVEQNGQDEVSSLPVIDAELTVAPNVPAPIKRDYPARVIVKLEALFACVKVIQWKCIYPIQLTQNYRIVLISTLQRHLTERQWRVIHCRGTPVSIASKHSLPDFIFTIVPQCPAHRHILVKECSG